MLCSNLLKNAIQNYTVNHVASLEEHEVIIE